MSLVLSFGTFDNFHPGHAFYLSQASLLSNELIVIVARDENVKRIKGREPRQNEVIRKRAVENFLKQEKIKGRAYLGYKEKSLKVIKKYQPDIIALGYDQMADERQIEAIVKELDLRTKIKRLKPYHPEKFKSSILKESNKLDKML
jgi:FAD synthetase